MSLENVKTVQTIYAAFGRGDVPVILANVTDDTRWSFNGGQPEAVAYHTPRVGKSELPRFFTDVGATVEIRSFEPREFMDCGPNVVVEVSMSFRNRKSGRVVEQSQLHWWTFDGGGKVARLVHYEDTAQVVAAST